MNNILRQIVRYSLLKARSSIVIKRILKDPIKALLRETPLSTNYKVFSTFLDSYGDSFSLLEGLRDNLKPGWQSILQPFKYTVRMPSRRDIGQRLETARTSVKNTFHFLETFNLPKITNILEIGCYDGARTYAIAERNNWRTS